MTDITTPSYVDDIFDSFISAYKDKMENSVVLFLPINFALIHEYIDTTGEIVSEQFFKSQRSDYRILILEEDSEMFFEIEYKNKTKTKITEETIGLYILNDCEELVCIAPLTNENKIETFDEGYYTHPIRKYILKSALNSYHTKPSIKI